MLIAKPRGGLANRLRVLASVHRAARRLGQPFAMHWRLVPGCGCRFHDLFENEFTELDDDAIATLTPLTVLADRKLPPSESGRHVEPPRLSPYYQAGHQLIDSCGFVGFSDERLGGGVLPPGFFDDISAFHRAMRPVAEVRQRVEAFAAAHLTPATIGVHMRRTDNDKARTMSSDEKFLTLMQQIIDVNDATRFFLATDCPDTERMMLDRFGDRVSVYPKRTPLVATTDKSPCRGTRDGVQDALVDMLLLSRTSHVMGCYWSTFSWAAAYFSGRFEQVNNV